jgi:Ca2+-binding RTX toxin-like protein
VVAQDVATTGTDVAVRLAIRAGDQIGFHQFGAMPDAFNSSTLLVSGVIEPDADHDGYGDETQDACPAEAALHVAPCHADVAVTMTGPAFGVVERDTPYDVIVANRGPSAAAGVTVTDVIPSGARFVRADGAVTCTPRATLRCALAPIAPGASGVLTIVLAGTAEGASFHHAVSVTTTSTDPTPGDHSAAVDTLVTGASVAPPPLTLAGAACVNQTFGGRDDDVLLGSSFGDRLYGRQGRDLLRGRAGNDVISARDRSRDVIDCGAGLDRVTADRRDRLRGCERVSRR